MTEQLPERLRLGWRPHWRNERLEELYIADILRKKAGELTEEQVSERLKQYETTSTKYLVPTFIADAVFDRMFYVVPDSRSSHIDNPNNDEYEIVRQFEQEKLGLHLEASYKGTYWQTHPAGFARGEYSVSRIARSVDVSSGELTTFMHAVRGRVLARTGEYIFRIMSKPIGQHEPTLQVDNIIKLTAGGQLALEGMLGVFASGYDTDRSDPNLTNW